MGRAALRIFEHRGFFCDSAQIGPTRGQFGSSLSGLFRLFWFISRR